MRKKWISLLLAGALLSLSVFSAGAEQLQGKSGMKVTFSGKSMKSNFNASELKKSAVELFPGDSLTYEVALENASGSAAAMYMSNAVRKSLEDSSNASGGAYTYDLRYVSNSGEELVLYDSATVGGEGSDGLEEATDNLGDNKSDNYFFLGNLSSGATGTVKLTVALDGETQGNDYQDSLADLRMKFAAEPAENGADDNGGNGNGGSHSNGGNGNSGRRTRPVKTGDETDLYPYYLAAGVSGLLLLILFFFRRKKEEENQEEA
jgi:LPXTG-motif cell wall-anchored protein